MLAPWCQNPGSVCSGPRPHFPSAGLRAEHSASCVVVDNYGAALGDQLRHARRTPRSTGARDNCNAHSQRNPPSPREPMLSRPTPPRLTDLSGTWRQPRRLYRQYALACGPIFEAGSL